MSAALVALTSAGPVVADPAAIGGVYNWTGFYVGGNGGYAWGQQKSTLNIADGPTGLTCHFCDGFNPLGGNDVTLAQNAGSPTLNPKTFTGGAQIGYNWQTSRWVYGLEVDFGTFRQRETTNTSFGLPGSTALIPFWRGLWRNWRLRMCGTFLNDR